MFEKSKREINSAKNYSEFMAHATSFDDFEIAWKNFLDSVYKVFHKAQNEIIRSVLDESLRNNFFSKYNKELKKDPLLCYVNQARNASIHTIAEIASEEKSIIIGHPAFPTTIINKLVVNKDGEVTEADIPVGGVVMVRKPVLIEIENRGVLYSVPCTHLGTGISADPFEISLLVIKYYEEFLQDAEKFLNSVKK